MRGINEVDLCVRVTQDRKYGRELFVLLYGLGFVLDGVEYHIPDGFVTDFMSVPRWGMIFVSQMRGAKAAALHDHLLRGGVPHQIADRIFREALRELGVGIVERNILYRAVALNATIKDIIGTHVTG